MDPKSEQSRIVKLVRCARQVRSTVSPIYKTLYIEYLLKSIVPRSAPNLMTLSKSNKNRLLLECSVENYNVWIRDLLRSKNSPYPNCRDKNERTPLIIACIKRNYNTVRDLADYSAVDVTCVDKYGMSAFAYCCILGYTEIAKLLYDTRGVLVNSIDNNKRSPLMLAVINSRIDTVKFLLGIETIQLELEDANGSNVIHLACKQTSPEITKWVLQKLPSCSEADTTSDLPSPNIYIQMINTLNNMGDCPISLISQKGDVESLDLLLERGAKVNTTNSKGLTALMLSLIHI